MLFDGMNEVEDRMDLEDHLDLLGSGRDEPAFNLNGPGVASPNQPSFSRSYSFRC